MRYIQFFHIASSGGVSSPLGAGDTLSCSPATSGDTVGSGDGDTDGTSDVGCPDVVVPYTRPLPVAYATWVPPTTGTIVVLAGDFFAVVLAPNTLPVEEDVVLEEVSLLLLPVPDPPELGSVPKEYSWLTDSGDPAEITR